MVDFRMGRLRRSHTTNGDTATFDPQPQVCSRTFDCQRMSRVSNIVKRRRILDELDSMQGTRARSIVGKGRDQKEQRFVSFGVRDANITCTETFQTNHG